MSTCFIGFGMVDNHSVFGECQKCGNYLDLPPNHDQGDNWILFRPDSPGCRQTNVKQCLQWFDGFILIV